MTLLSEIYAVTLKKGNRGACKQGWARATIGECFVTHKDFKEVAKLLTPFFGTRLLYGDNVVKWQHQFYDRHWEYWPQEYDLEGGTRILSYTKSIAYSLPTNPIAPGKWTWSVLNNNATYGTSQITNVGLAKLPVDLEFGSEVGGWPSYSIYRVYKLEKAYFALDFDGTNGWLRIWRTGGVDPEVDTTFTVAENEALVLYRYSNHDKRLYSDFYWDTEENYRPVGYTNGLRFL